MFVSPAFAQSGSPVAGGTDLLISLVPFVLIFVIMYFLIIRPQRQRVKEHQAMVSGLRRGDTIVTSGGLIGKVTRIIDDNEMQLELAEGVRVRLLRSMVQEVRAKGEPAKE